MIFPHFIVGVPSSADSQPMFGEKMREIPVTKKNRVNAVRTQPDF